MLAVAVEAASFEGAQDGNGRPRMQTIIGVDPSVAKTGVAVRNPDGEWSFRFIEPPKGMRDPKRLQWIAQSVFVARSPYTNILLVIEKPMQSRGNPVNLILHWRIREELADSLTVATLPVFPVHLKQFATGDARAEKGTIALAVARKWGELLPPDAKEDTIEALVLAKLGECWMTPDAGHWTEYELDAALLRKRKAGERTAEEDSLTFTAPGG